MWIVTYLWNQEQKQRLYFNLLKLRAFLSRAERLPQYRLIEVREVINW